MDQTISRRLFGGDDSDNDKNKSNNSNSANHIPGDHSPFHHRILSRDHLSPDIDTNVDDDATNDDIFDDATGDVINDDANDDNTNTDHDDDDDDDGTDDNIDGVFRNDAISGSSGDSSRRPFAGRLDIPSRRRH